MPSLTSLAVGVYNLPKWLTRKFRTIAGEPIRNYDLVVHMLTLLHLRGERNGVRFKHVKGHRGQEGNEEADVSLVVEMDQGYELTCFAAVGKEGGENGRRCGA
jgi:ribonuclease HI